MWSEILSSKILEILNEDKINKDKCWEILMELHYCDCCNRHQINKPFLPVKWKERDLNNLRNINPCTCDCRHMARLICRFCD